MLLHLGPFITFRPSTDIAMSSSCIKDVFPRNLVQGISVACLRKRLAGTTWTETHYLAARVNEAYGQGNRRLGRSVQSFAIIKSPSHEKSIFLKIRSFFPFKFFQGHNWLTNCPDSEVHDHWKNCYIIFYKPKLE